MIAKRPFEAVNPIPPTPLNVPSLHSVANYDLEIKTRRDTEGRLREILARGEELLWKKMRRSNIRS
jgi:hypothetical protein